MPDEHSLVSVAWSSNHITHTAHTFSSLSRSLAVARAVNSVFRVRVCENIQREEGRGVRPKSRGWEGEGVGSVMPHKLPVLADASGYSERLTGTKFPSVWCDMTLFSTLIGQFDVSFFHGSWTQKPLEGFFTFCCVGNQHKEDPIIIF